MKWVVGQDFRRSQVPTHGGSSGPLEPPAGSYKNNCKLNSMLAQSLNKEKKKIKENLIMIQSSRTMLSPSVNNVYGKENKKKENNQEEYKNNSNQTTGFLYLQLQDPRWQRRKTRRRRVGQKTHSGSAHPRVPRTTRRGRGTRGQEQRPQPPRPTKQKIRLTGVCYS